jgi:DNA-binding MarR family transcriptional regulator
MDGYAALSQDARDRLRDLPPSAKLVAKALEQEDRLTQSGLTEETLLPARTVRDAVARLEDQRLVDSRLSLVDARKRVYTLAGERAAEEADGRSVANP